MALRALMKRRELDRAKAELEALRAKKAELETREAELAQMIDEAETEEERAAVEEEVTQFETDSAENAAGIADLETRIAGIEAELAEIEAETTPEPAADPEPVERDTVRGEITTMNKRNIFHKMDLQTRTAMFEREDVKEFLATVRTALGEQRAITNAGLLIPEVFLGVLRENIEGYSKLYKYVNVRQIGGTGTVVVMGTIPEAVWTDCCGVLNELSLTFNDAEVGCWKVGGFFDICNATVEDADIDLASELLTVLGQAIGLALDKAILYGLGTRMPLGVVTRLAQTSKPDSYPDTARTWVDLHTKNVIKINATGKELFQKILEAAATSIGKYSRGERVWAMAETTYNYLQAQGLSINAAGAIVTGMGKTMPILGGDVVILDFIADGDVITGYADTYLLAERAGAKLAQSEHVKFIEDRTVFKGTARYDGQPVIAEAFTLFNVKNTNPTTSVDFAPDEANTDVSE